MEKNLKQRKTFKEIFISSAGWSVFTMFVWELIEEGMENLIAYLLSSAVAVFITKALSTLAIITATQGIKVAIKRFLTPLIKNLTYKEGNDKMSKIKKFFSWVYANKCTIGGIGAGALTVVSGLGVINVDTLPSLFIGSFNVTPVIYYGVLGILTIICSFFPETIKKFAERKAQVKCDKEHKALVKEAKHKIALETKLENQTQAQREKEQQKSEAERTAKEQKEKADAEHNAKVNEIIAKLKAEAQSNKQE